MTNLEIAVRLFCYVSLALTVCLILLWFWPSDEKLYKLRPEDFASDEEFVKAAERREREEIDKRQRDA